MTTRDDLVLAIHEMPVAAIRRDRESVERWLAHRSPLVRYEAAEALARAGVGAEAVRKRLHVERDDLVLATLCEAAMLLDDRESITALKAHCRHPSWLVRKQAAWAVSEMLEKRSTSLLRDLLRGETSRRVRPVLQAALFQWGDDTSLDELVKSLHSRDYLVRVIAANLIGQNIRRPVRPSVVQSLKQALEREETRAAREAIAAAIASRASRKRPRK